MKHKVIYKYSFPRAQMVGSITFPVGAVLLPQAEVQGDFVSLWAEVDCVVDPTGGVQVDTVNTVPRYFQIAGTGMAYLAEHDNGAHTSYVCTAFERDFGQLLVWHILEIKYAEPEAGE